MSLAAVAVSMPLAVGVSPASAAPASDAQGYVDSTARCTSPDTAVVFGSTKASRVAICQTPSGELEYRGVRVRDGARLITSASQSSGGTFVADNDGIGYTVSADSLVISSGSQVVREEAMLDYHGPSATQLPPSTSKTTTAPKSIPTPDLPPLAAEVGGSG